MKTCVNIGKCSNINREYVSMKSNYDPQNNHKYLTAQQTTSDSPMKIDAQTKTINKGQYMV